MFLAMNRFRVAPGSEDTFEQMWLSRDSQLPSVPGFVAFNLLRGPRADDHTLYASHTVWQDQPSFEAWTQSDAFRQAHRAAGDARPSYLGPPQFEGFTSIQAITPDRS